LSNRKLLYFNSLFDLELGNHATAANQRAASEMTLLFAPCGQKDDVILLDSHVEETYWHYLNALGISTPALNYGTPCKGLEGHAWGWNTGSVRRLSQLGALCHHADLEIIKQINSRRFCSKLGTRYGFGIPRSLFFSCKEHLRQIHLPDMYKFPLVIKPEFGGSGYGFVHINNPEEYAHSLQLLPESFSGVIEPWYQKIHDLSSVCQINPDRSISGFRYQRSFTNSRGTFYGIYLDDNDPVIDKWKDEIESASYKAAETIAAAGYFGPAGFDSIIYEADGEQKLAAIIEINARHVMSDIAHAIRNSCARGKLSFFRLLSRKRSRLPTTYNELHTLLDDIDFNNGNGCMVISPLTLQHGHQKVQPYRNAFFLSADSEKKLWEIDQKLRAITSYP
jgi:hypothetical protein